MGLLLIVFSQDSELIWWKRRFDKHTPLLIWCMYMNRYQIYLDPKTVSVFDRVAVNLEVARSQVIRDALSRVAKEFKKALTATRSFDVKNHPLMKMSGIGKGASKNLASRVDEIYELDRP